MPVPNSIDDLSTTPADNFPLGTEQVFPNLDNYMRALSAFVAQLRDRLDAEGLPLAAVIWHGGNRSSIQAARLAPLDGQLLNRVDYPALWSFVSAGGYPLIAESEWQSTTFKRASFSLGNGSTTFRAPDLNGLQANSIGSVSLRGDGAASGGAPGIIQSSQNQAHNHTAGAGLSGSHTHSVNGTAAAAGQHAHGMPRGDNGAYGAYALRQSENITGNQSTGSDGLHTHSVSGTAAAAGSHSHDITVSASGGDEARGKVATGVWVMRVK